MPPKETSPTRSRRRDVPLGERRRRAHGEVERARRAAPHLGEAVEEEHDVHVPLRVLLVDPQLAAAGARPPVDPPHAVAERERPEVGELECPRPSCARARRRSRAGSRPGGAARAAPPGAGRPSPARARVEPAGAGDEAERVAHADVDDRRRGRRPSARRAAAACSVRGSPREPRPPTGLSPVGDATPGGSSSSELEPLDRPRGRRARARRSTSSPSSTRSRPTRTPMPQLRIGRQRAGRRRAARRNGAAERGELGRGA